MFPCWFTSLSRRLDDTFKDLVSNNTVLSRVEVINLDVWLVYLKASISRIYRDDIFIFVNVTNLDV